MHVDVPQWNSNIFQEVKEKTGRERERGDSERDRKEKWEKRKRNEKSVKNKKMLKKRNKNQVKSIGNKWMWVSKVKYRMARNLFFAHDECS